MLRIAQIAKTAVALTVILTAYIHTAPAKASQCQQMGGSECYRAILAGAGALDKYVPYFRSEVAVVNFARTIGNNACSAVINAGMSPNDAVESVMKQYRSQLINMGMSQPEADFLTTTAMSAGVEVDCPTHINRSVDGSRPRTTGITLH